MRMGEPTANVVEDAINKELDTLEEGTVMVCHHSHQDHHKLLLILDSLIENLILHGIFLGRLT